MISLQITPYGERQITAVHMTLNQSLVPASYSVEKQTVLYQPTQPLPPGDYAVHCRIDFNRSDSCTQEWHFTVAADALSELPEPTPQQQAVFDAVNLLRRSLGMPPFVLNRSLCAAAQAHSHYLSVYGFASGHNEQREMPGATGAQPQDRAGAFGYGGCINEGIHGDSDPFGGAQIQDLFDCPYHRINFLQPDAGDIGTGCDGAAPNLYVTTLEFGRSTSDAVVVAPFPDQKNVPTRWDCEESPSPLRLYPSLSLPVGYVIVFAHFGPVGSRISVSSAALTTSAGQPVSVYVNTPVNDNHLTNAALIIPQKPLVPGTTYHVSVKATTNDGRDISREWDFSTAVVPVSDFAGS